MLKNKIKDDTIFKLKSSEEAAKRHIAWYAGNVIKESNIERLASLKKEYLDTPLENSESDDDWKHGDYEESDLEQNNEYDD